MTTVYLEQAIRILAREATNLTTEALKPLGVSTLQYDILEAVNRHMEDPGPVAFRPVRISEKLYMGAVHIREETRKLAKDGYIRVAKGSSRLLTPAGINLLGECRVALRPVNRCMQIYFDDYGMEAVAEAFVKQQEGTN